MLTSTWYDTETTMLVLAGIIILGVSVAIGSDGLRIGRHRRQLRLSLALVAMSAIAFGLLHSSLLNNVEVAGMPLKVYAQSAPTGDASQAALTQAATPTNTPTPFDTPTALPSLTPTVSETPIILYTPIHYVSTYAVGTPTDCTVIARTMAYLRGDPSEKIAAIGTIFAGSLLNVTGRTANKQWWRVINTDGDVSVEGWVRADYVTADAACTDAAVPPVDGTETPTHVPTTRGATVAITPAACALLTTTPASLRPDPSRLHAPLTQIPERTALTPLGKSADGQWWQVRYGNQDGWIGAGAVIASTNCSAIPTVTAVPTSQ